VHAEGQKAFKPLNTELNPIRHLLALLGDHHILHVNRVKVNGKSQGYSTYLIKEGKFFYYSFFHYTTE